MTEDEKANRSIRLSLDGAKGRGVVGLHNKTMLALVEKLRSVTTQEAAAHFKCCESDAHARLLFLAYGGAINHVEATRWTARDAPRHGRPRGKAATKGRGRKAPGKI